jgi:hypothetical protein
MRSENSVQHLPVFWSPVYTGMLLLLYPIVGHNDL